MEINEHDMDVELLITLIEERPILWDKSLETYKSKIEITNAWMEVCYHLNPSFKTLNDGEKNKYGKRVILFFNDILTVYTYYTVLMI